MSTVTTNKFKSTTIYGILNVIDNPNGNIISNTTLSGNLTVGGKINNIPVSTIAYISNLTSDIQAQIDSKANTTDLTTTNNNVTTISSNITSLQTSVNLKGGLSSDNTWSGTNTFNSNIPTTTLTPSLSSQFITKAYADSNYAGTGILSGTNSWTGTNTYILNLPTSSIAPTSSSHFTNKSYVDLKAPLASPTFTGTVSGITKAMVGLSNVDNTTDVNKPVSDATTTALNLKSNLASPTFTGTLTTAGLTATGSTSLTLKSNLASPTFTGTLITT